MIFNASYHWNIQWRNIDACHVRAFTMLVSIFISFIFFGGGGEGGGMKYCLVTNYIAIKKIIRNLSYKDPK